MLLYIQYRDHKENNYCEYINLVINDLFKTGLKKKVEF